MDHLKLDLCFALRSLARRPGFTAIAVLTLALGIGANTGIFSVVNGVFLRSLLYLEPDRLVMVWRYDLDDPSDNHSMSGPDMDDVRELDAVSAIEGISTTSVTLTGSGTPELVEAASVTGGLLAVFGLTPELGRDLAHEDGFEGAARVVVSSHDLWQTQFGGRRDVIGTPIELNERSFEIVALLLPASPSRSLTPRRALTSGADNLRSDARTLTLTLLFSFSSTTQARSPHPGARETRAGNTCRIRPRLPLLVTAVPPDRRKRWKP